MKKFGAILSVHSYIWVEVNAQDETEAKKQIKDHAWTKSKLQSVCSIHDTILLDELD